MNIGLYDLLPLVIQIRDQEASGGSGGASILQRVVGGAIQDEADSMVALIAGMRSLISPLSTTDLILSIIARFLGLTEFSFSDVVSDQRQYTAELPYAHRIKGALLSIIRERHSRNIAPKTYLHELWKYEVNAVDEYVVKPSEAPSGTADRAARVVFIDDPTESGPPVGGPPPSDGSVTGEFAAGQIPYLTAKDWRRLLNNVFPVHVIVPPRVSRWDESEIVSVPTDAISATVFALFSDASNMPTDSLLVHKTCTADCQLGCQTRCEVLCEFTCETTCENSCQAKCENECQATCQFYCEDDCQLSCIDACQSFCQTQCQSVCQGDCESSCTQDCQNGCQNSDEICASFCQVNCQNTGTETICTDTCQVNCQSDAQQPCPDGQLPVGEGV